MQEKRNSVDNSLTEMEENRVSAGGLTGDQPDEQIPDAPLTTLCNNINRYCITAECAKGTFAKVVKAINVDTSQEVAIKTYYSEHCTLREMKMLEKVSVLDHAKYNLVNFIEHLNDCTKPCLVFEWLDMTLLELLQRRGGPLTPSEIRPIAYQLLKTFSALKSIGVVHAALRPDNVMLVNQEREPFRVKLCNFGMSFMTSEDMRGMKIQSTGYGSPEDSLGLPITVAIDMWSLGCVLLYLYLGNHPFSVNCEYQAVKGFVDLLGQPDDDFLKAGIFSLRYFMKDVYWSDPAWSMKTQTEFEQGADIQVKEWPSKIRSLDDLISLYPVVNGRSEVRDRRAFVSLLKGLLQVDPKKRLTPERALSHPFLTIVHLTEDLESPYFNLCLEKMEDLDLNDEDDEEAFSNVAGEQPGVEQASVSHSERRMSADMGR